MPNLSFARANTVCHCLSIWCTDEKQVVSCP